MTPTWPQKYIKNDTQMKPKSIQKHIQETKRNKQETDKYQKKMITMTMEELAKTIQKQQKWKSSDQLQGEA